MSKTQAELAQVHADLLCSAFEGGSNYWYVIEEMVYPPGKAAKDFQYPHLEIPFLEGGAIRISSGAGGEEHRNPNDTKGLWTLDRAAVRIGWERMIAEQPQHYADAMTEKADASTGDVFLQLCLFGEVIFG